MINSPIVEFWLQTLESEIKRQENLDKEEEERNRITKNLTKVLNQAYDALNHAEKEILFLERIITKLCFTKEAMAYLDKEELKRVQEIELIPRESRENECSLQKDGRKFTDTFPIFSVLRENWKKFVNRK